MTTWPADMRPLYYWLSWWWQNFGLTVEQVDLMTLGVFVVVLLLVFYLLFKGGR